MKKIKDERLILKNLKNIRIAFVFQSLGLMAIILYNFIFRDINPGESPVFFLLILTGVLVNFLNLSISIDHEEPKQKEHSLLASYKRNLLIALVIGVVFTFIYLLASPERAAWEAILFGAIFWICFSATFTIGYVMKKRRWDDDEG
ncbi:hypothetical protein [Tuberibacillus sp. Marseille-P3662]|uniref:hypothetical protein n=1 Tax=Tuberibacillus sp. Marseille-P3662 TaxID=1965358 RepID=UPI000A1CE60F|nr:hypothetical protein [Tuberibacillus sp. Marseille-P3662]